MRHTDGEVILLWTLPVLALIWLSVFLLFPGFIAPALQNQNIANAVMSFRNIMSQTYGLGKMCQRLFMLSQTHIGSPQIDMRRCILRIDLQGLFKMRYGFFDFTFFL